MNIARGIIAGLIWALLGPVVIILVVGAYTILSREFNYVGWWQMRGAVCPLVGVSIYLGLTAWATYTPKRNYRFGKTLAIIFFTAMPMTWVLFPLELTPKRYKGIEHPEMYLSEFLLFFLPPFIIACWLICIRQTVIGDAATTSAIDGHSKKRTTKDTKSTK